MTPYTRHRLNDSKRELRQTLDPPWTKLQMRWLKPQARFSSPCWYNQKAKKNLEQSCKRYFLKQVGDKSHTPLFPTIFYPDYFLSATFCFLDIIRDKVAYRPMNAI